MSQVQGQGKGVNCEPCQRDHSYTLTEGFCLFCCEFLCTPCIVAHRKNKASRNHKIIENGDIPKSLQTVQILKESLFCMSHVDTEIAHKCEDHEVYICDICLGRDHRHCSKVTDLATVEDMEDDQTMMESLATVKEEILILKGNKEKQLSKIEKEMNIIAQERGRIKQNIISKLNVLSKEQMEETDSFAKSLMKSMTDECADIEAHESDISAFLELLHVTASTRSSVSIAIVSEMVQKYIHKIEKLLSQRRKSGYIQLAFVPSVSTSDFKSLGELKKTRKDSVFMHASDGDVLSKDSKQISNVDAKEVSHIDVNEVSNIDVNAVLNVEVKTELNVKVKEVSNVKIKEVLNAGVNAVSNVEVREVMMQDTSELKQSTYVGIASLMGGRIVLLDETNDNIKLYEKKDLIGCVSLSLKPRAMYKLSDDDIVISFFQEIARYTYSKSKRTFEKIRRFPIKHGCVNLSHNGIYLALLCKKSGIQPIYIIEIRQLHDGKVMKTVPLPTNMNPKSFICLDDHYFVVDFNGRLSRVDKDGKQVDDCPSLAKAVALTLDGDGNLVVCCQETMSAVIYTVSKTNLDTHIKTVPGLSSVEIIYFDRKTKKLLVACRDGIYSVTLFA